MIRGCKGFIASSNTINKDCCMSVKKISSYQPDTNLTTPLIGQTLLATVCEMRAGEATKIFLQNTQTEINVIKHAATVSSLNLTDDVLILLLEEGAIVLHRLRNKGERPQSGFTEKEDGTLLIRSKQSVVIETDRACFELHADGRIKLDGNEIYSISKGVQYIIGSQLNLN